MQCPRPYLLSLVLLAVCCGIICAQPLLTLVDSRQTTSLNGQWRTIIDPFENGYYSYRYTVRDDGYFRNQKPRDKSDLVEYDFDRSPTLAVPGDWNSQRPELFFYEGTLWYKRDFDYHLPGGRRLFLHFGAANYHSMVWLNGEELGEHTGGFTPFQFEITDALQAGNNTLVVKVDNVRRREGVPTLNADWWNYGGLTRRVLLVETPATLIRDAWLQLDPTRPDRAIGEVFLDGPDRGQPVTVAIEGTGIAATVRPDGAGRAALDLPAPPRRWSPGDPHTYRVTFRTATDTLHDTVGFRTITTQGTDILLNGEPVFLRGISIHEESPLRAGRAATREDAAVLLQWAEELGCNFVRLAHYPHNEFMIREAERRGILVWSEIPVYWTIRWDNPDTYALAEHQLTRMIARDRNRAAVIIWSVANETPRSPERLDFLSRLIERARALDPTRLISAATEVSYAGDSLKLDDPLGDHLDVIGANEYMGWYGGALDAIGERTWSSRFDKPLVISEFGAGALQGLRGETGARWTEDYQAELYRRQLAMLDKVPFLRGMSPWILVDFRSPRRPLPDIQDFWNRKGLISDRGIRKAAFRVLQEYYGTRAAEGER